MEMEIQLRCEGSKGIVRSKVYDPVADEKSPDPVYKPYDPVNEPIPATERKAGAFLSFRD
jgi:hypothetical protein